MFIKILSTVFALAFITNIALADEGYRTYQIVNGDTLASIAQKNLKDVRYLAQLFAYNGITQPSQLVPGQTVLKVPYSISKDRIARLTMIVGEVQISRNGNPMVATPASTLIQSDTIQTGPGAKAEIQLDEGSVVRVGPSTQFALSGYAYLNGNRSTNLNLTQGNMSMRVTKLTGDSDFQVSTVTAVAGVRGTFFYVNFDPKSKELGVAVYNGAVSVKPEKGTSTATPVMVKAGHAVNVSSEGTPSKVFEIPAKIEWAD